MRRQRQVPGRIAVASGVVLVAVAGLWVLAGQGPGRPSASQPMSPTPTQGGPGVASFVANGYAFDYPATWQRYPFEFAAMSHFTVVGYLSNRPLDTSQICLSSENSTSCNFRNYPIEAGQVVLEVADWGWFIDDPVAFWDRPTEGRPTIVGGMAAIVSESASGSDRSLKTWKVNRPDAFGNWIQLEADLQGPGTGLARAQLDAIIASFRFEPSPVRLDPGMADQIGAAALATLRAQDPEAYACYPPIGQSVRTTITAAPGAPLRAPLQAVCSSALVPTDIGYWRLELTVAWGPDLAHPDHHYLTVQWLRADGTLSAQSGSGDSLPNCCRG